MEETKEENGGRIPAGQQATGEDGGREEERDRKARKAFLRLTGSEDGEEHVSMSLRSILGGDILAGRWFRRQILYILFLSLLAIVYVSNRYACQQEMIRGQHLADTLLDRRYKTLTLSSQLKEMTRRSNVEESLRDTSLQTSNAPLYRLRIEE